MHPRCESAAEVVRWAKFAPLGERGVDGANADAPYFFTPMKEYLQKANEQTLIVVQIKSPRALTEVEAIAAVSGVDVLMIGPADLSVPSGVHFICHGADILLVEKRAGANPGTIFLPRLHIRKSPPACGGVTGGGP
jgi:2-keto-3-deoxy-L-rhamnonate aldolase RhmA